MYSFKYGVFLNPGIWCLRLFPPVVGPASGPWMGVMPEFTDGVRLPLLPVSETTGGGRDEPLPRYGESSTWRVDMDLRGRVGDFQWRFRRGRCALRSLSIRGKTEEGSQ